MLYVIEDVKICLPVSLNLNQRYTDMRGDFIYIRWISKVLGILISLKNVLLKYQYLLDALYDIKIFTISAC